MSTPRRTVVLLIATLAVLLGATVPAQAAYSDRSPAFTSTIGTVRVAAPTNLSTAGTKCVTTYNAWNNTYTSTLEASLSWRASTTTRGVTGYVVTAYFANGQVVPVTWVNAPGTSVSGTYDAYYANQNIRVTVTTHTSYGWTAESTLSGVIKC